MTVDWSSAKIPLCGELRCCGGVKSAGRVVLLFVMLYCVAEP